jgi:hypothetical protein
VAQPRTHLLPAFLVNSKRRNQVILKIPPKIFPHRGIERSNKRNRLPSIQGHLPGTPERHPNLTNRDLLHNQTVRHR